LPPKRSIKEKEQTAYSMKSICLTLALLLATVAFGQRRFSVIVDSLNNVLQQNPPAKEQVPIYSRLLYFYSLSDSAKTLATLQTIKNLAAQTQQLNHLSDAHTAVGWLYVENNHYAVGKAHFDTAAQIAQQANYPKGQAEALFGIGVKHYYQGLFNQSLALFEQALPLYQQANDKRGLISTYFHMATVYESQSNWAQSIKYHTTSLALAEQFGHEMDVAVSYSGLANVYQGQGNYPKALEYYLKTIDSRYFRADSFFLSGSYINIGSVYQKQGNYEMALEYYQKGLAIDEKTKNLRALKEDYRALGQLYLLQNQNTKALQYLTQSLQINKQLADVNGATYGHLYIGKAYLALGRFDSAAQAFNTAMALVPQSQDKEVETAILIQQARLHLGQNQPQKGLPYATNGLAQARQIKSAVRLEEALKVLVNLHKATGNYRAAMGHQESLALLQDSTKDQEITRAMAILETEFKAKQEKDSLQNLYAAETQTLQKDIDRGNTVIAIVTTGLVLFIAVAYVVFVLYRNNARKNKALTQLNHKINRQRQDLEAMNKTQAKLFSIISHDIRAPLSVFNSTGRVIRNHVKKQQFAAIEQVALEIEKNTTITSHLLDNLLAWSLESQQEFMLSPAPLMATALLQEMQQVYQGVAQNKGIDFSVQVQGQPQLWADRNSTLTILRNLINNALKFTPPGGQVQVSAQQSQGQVVFTIKDTGAGLSPEQLQSIRQQQSPPRQQGTGGEAGLGLGLRLVHEFVLRNQGSLEVQSQPGQGSTFTLKLPAYQQEQEQARLQEQTQARPQAAATP